MEGMRIGVMMAPLLMFGMLLRDRSATRKFIAAGAIEPDRARRPSSLGIDSARDIQDAVRTGGLVAVGDGRYWAQAALHRRRRIIVWSFAIAVWGAVAGVAAYLWFPL